ncbi:cytochrome c, class I [Polynucleobacter sp. 31A-FELB]|jgi:cytochrome c|uniref:c-type cytochrome n=1 Tax=Polynucleobacter sp. 31A-FELB TaxID=2689096 RepID=UPI001C0BCD77|nr:c-type cytochrome [Polynucleobacter sp. 31A-FELB]MBU3586847.1 cytochrome c, class I [Polynucleobacter sp. 31A-FELB]
MNFFAQQLKYFLLVALFSLCSLSARAAIDDAKAAALAKQNACLGCHAVDKKVVGPSFQAVAKKYATDPAASVFLKNKILKGGAGSWGVVPMPANAKLSDEDVSLLTGWILRGAPSTN